MPIESALVAVAVIKPELLLQEHGIRDTIVVYGSTRIPEPVVAARNVEALRRALKANPGDRDVARKLEVAERILAKSHYYDVARAFGRLVGANSAQDGTRSQAVIMTGGGPGIMEAANRGAFDAGAKSVGLNISLPHEQYPNPYITPELCLRFHYFALRKLHLLLRAKALVAFPGGYGTFDELFEVLTLVQTRKIRPLPIVLVGEDYWRHAFDMEFLVDEGVIDPEDRELFWFAETATEIWNGIRHWHDASGASLELKSQLRGHRYVPFPTARENALKLSFHGADRDVTGSCHLVESAGKRILIDCGLHQGSADDPEPDAGLHKDVPCAVPTFGINYRARTRTRAGQTEHLVWGG
jgi:uncharacterized protein (TIGR00730 family)